MDVRPPVPGLRLRGSSRFPIAAAVLLLLSACGTDSPGGSPTSVGSTGTVEPSLSTSPPPTSDPGPTTPGPSESPGTPISSTAPSTGTTGPTATTPATEVTVPVYFLTDSRAGLRLVREMRAVPGDAPVRRAVEAMLAGPSDPDYVGPWNPSTTVLGVDIDDDLVTVDLSGDARTADIGSEGAARMIQQLVYTVAGAVDADLHGSSAVRVQLNIDGAPAGELWGAVTWNDPISTEEPLAVRLLVQIDTPTEGSTTTSPVTVRGDAAVYEANLLWEVRDAGGAVVDSGFTTTENGQMFAAYEFSVELEPGSYTVVITEDDASGGEGGPSMSDSRAIVVS